MAFATQKSVASLMPETLDRQAAVARMKISFEKKQIEQILISYRRDGNCGPYNELLKVLKDCPLNDDNFRILFEDCLSCVIVLNRKFNSFLDALYSIEWASREESLVKLYSRFSISLVASHFYHCRELMTSWVKLFKCDGENWKREPPQEIVSKWSNVHSVVNDIVLIMPMTFDTFMETVIEQFPYYNAGCFVNRAYVHNLIHIGKSWGPLLSMSIIVEKMVEMDANIVDRDKNKIQDTIFEINVDEKDEVSETLDYCMLEMLNWLAEEREMVRDIMCFVFERDILPTRGIRYVQFLLLYTISISQQCADQVFTNLWKMAAGLHEHGPGALATRRTAASHLAGLLARCVRVSNSRLIHYLKTMAEWCHSYITVTQESTVADNTEVHGAFHAICHAIFYLVAFKNHYLFMSKESLNFVESLNLPRLVTCSLNPLKTCPPQVTRAFSSVTRSHQVVYCQAIIEKNSRLTLQNTVQKYDEWFPYDPYTLPVSGKMIWPLCMEYKDVFKDGDYETQYTSLKRKLEAKDGDYLLPGPSQKLPTTLSNCISPGFKTSESIYRTWKISEMK